MNYAARVYTSNGTRIPIVLCLYHLAMRAPDLADDRQTQLTIQPCDLCHTGTRPVVS